MRPQVALVHGRRIATDDRGTLAPDPVDGHRVRLPVGPGGDQPVHRRATQRLLDGVPAQHRRGRADARGRRRDVPSAGRGAGAVASVGAGPRTDGGRERSATARRCFSRGRRIEVRVSMSRFAAVNRRSSDRRLSSPSCWMAAASTPSSRSARVAAGAGAGAGSPVAAGAAPVGRGAVPASVAFPVPSSAFPRPRTSTTTAPVVVRTAPYSTRSPRPVTTPSDAAPRPPTSSTSSARLAIRGQEPSTGTTGAASR